VNFFKESLEELRKVTWPTKDQAAKLTVITIIFTILCTLLLAVSDFGFKKGYEYMLSTSPKVQNQQANPSEPTADNTPDIDMGAATVTDSDGNELDVEFTPNENASAEIVSESNDEASE